MTSRDRPPAALTAAMKQQWDQLSPEWQEEILRLEAASRRGVEKYRREQQQGEGI